MIEKWEVPEPEDKAFRRRVRREIREANARVEELLGRPIARRRRPLKFIPEHLAMPHGPRNSPARAERREFVLAAALEGKSAAEIARELVTYAQIVHNDLAWWRRRYGVTTNEELLVLAASGEALAA